MLAVALAFVLCNIVSAAGPKAYFNIPPGTLEDALRSFGHQAGVSIVYGSENKALSASKVKTRATVVGEFELAEALQRILEGTGLELMFQFVSADQVIVKPKESLATVEKPASATPRAAVDHEEGAGSAEPLEVIVTGSFIRGMNAITAPMIPMGKQEKKQAAYGSVQDMLRALPQTFGGGPSEDFSLTANFNRGSSIDLRGLGSGATLVLINGRRQPVSSIDGNFVDVSTIPWSAVERIDVLTDGASALYGSDAIAGVVNIIMRDELPGIGETQLRMGGSAGGADEKLLSQSFGHRWDSGKWLLTYQYRERSALASVDRRYAASDDKRPFGGTDLRSIFSSPGNILDPATQQPVFGIGANGELSSTINLYNRRETSDLLPDASTHSAFFTGSQKIGDRVELFAEGRFGRRHVSATERAQELLLPVPASNPFFVDPFGDSPFVLVAYNLLKDLGPIEDHGTTHVGTGTLGLTADFAHQWRATLSGSFGQERMRWLGYNQADFGILLEKLADPDPSTAFNPFGSGTSPSTLEAIRIIQDEQAVSQIESIGFTADGSLPRLPAGTPKLAFGFDFRRESLDRKLGLGIFERKISAGFMELSIPLVPHLDLSLAGRYEKYSDFGNSFNPKIGLRWKASDAVRLRGSWGTSFRAPTLVNMYDHSGDAGVALLLPDSLSESGFSTVLLEQGNNPNLQEETARTWAVGVDLAPSFIPDLTLSGTYYVIDYDDRIFSLPVTVPLSDVLAGEEWSALVTRNPPRSQIERICNAVRFFGSREECLASSPAAALDLRLRNLSATTVRGIDVNLEHALRTSYGSFNLGFNASRVFSFQQSLTRALPGKDLTGTALNAPALRLRGTADWYQHGRDREGLGMSLAIDHLTGSRDRDSPTVTRIAPWTTLDLQLSYQTPRTDAWLGDMEFVLNAVNVLDEDPPFVNREEGYDPANADPTGRVISVSVRKNW